MNARREVFCPTTPHVCDRGEPLLNMPDDTPPPSHPAVELFAALAGIAERVHQMAAADPELQQQVARLATALGRLFAAAAPSEQAEASPSHITGTTTANAATPAASVTVRDATPPPEQIALEPTTREPEPARDERQPEFVSASEAIEKLTFHIGQASEPTVELPESYAQRAADTVPDLELVELRARLKAEGARWAAERRRLLAEGADHRAVIAPRDREIIARARELPECYLWMNNPHAPEPENLALYEDLAGCFETLALAANVLRRAVPRGATPTELVSQAMHLAAEAQSALRSAVAALDAQPDPDQMKVYLWLRQTAAEMRLFVKRYMRADDIADPTTWRDIAARLERVREQVEESQQIVRRQQDRLKRLRYHASLILKHPTQANHEHDWRRISEAVGELIDEGMPPSSVELRQILLPLVDLLPEEDLFSPGLRLVWREIDRYLAAREETEESAETSPPSPEVQQAAELLAGRTVVLIGGDRRPAAERALLSALRLKKLDWIETREHQSLESFESHVARPDVAVVLLAIRWSSHSYGDVKQFCDRYGKPLVRLPGGYNPNQVARQILDQCSGRLRTVTADSA